jgi:hypothetical protein
MTSFPKGTGLLSLVLIMVMVVGACASQTATTEGSIEDAASSDSSGSTSTGAEILLRDVALAEWTIDAAANVDPVTGRVLLNGAGVAGVIVQVDDYTLPEATAADGSFTYPADVTVPHRYIVKVVDASQAEVAGERLSRDDARMLEATRTGFNVAYGVQDLQIRREDASIEVSGRLVGASGASLAPVLFAFSLSGRVTDANGEPAADVWVSFRPADRETWTLDATEVNGRFQSFFFPSTESTGAGPYSVIVSKGARSWEAQDGVSLARLKSATVDIRLPRSPQRSLKTAARGVPEKGAYYETVLVGLALGDKVLTPSSATWLDRQGRFSLVLPAAKTPKHASIWISREFVFVDRARPGAAMDLSALPSALAPDVPRGIRDVRLHH